MAPKYKVGDKLVFEDSYRIYEILRLDEHSDGYFMKKLYPAPNGFDPYAFREYHIAEAYARLATPAELVLF
jgi:hypothetical protein